MNNQYHFSVKSVGSSNGGAVKKANYMAGENNEPSEVLKQSAYNAGKKIGNTDFSYKNDEVFIDGIVSPYKFHWGNSYNLWKSVEERDTRKIYTRIIKNKNTGKLVEEEKGFELAKNIICHIPHQLVKANRAENLLKGFALSIKDKHQVPVQYVAHYPSGINRTEQSNLNYHSHILIGCRGIDAEGKWHKRKAEFTKANRNEILKEWRAEWAHRINSELEQLGEEERVDHRSFADRGIEYYRPMKHEGVGVSRNESAVIHNAREMLFREEFDRARSQLGEDSDESTLDAIASNLRAEIEKIPAKRLQANLRKARTQITKNLKYRNPDNIVITKVRTQNDNAQSDTRQNNRGQQNQVSGRKPEAERFGAEIQKSSPRTGSPVKGTSELREGISEAKNQLSEATGRSQQAVGDCQRSISEAESGLAETRRRIRESFSKNERELRSKMARNWGKRQKAIQDMRNGLAIGSDPELDNGRRGQPYVNQYVVGQRQQSARSDNHRKAIADSVGQLGTGAELPIEVDERFEKRLKLASRRKEKLLSNPIVEVENSPRENSPGEVKTENKEVEIPEPTPQPVAEVKPKKDYKKIVNSAFMRCLEPFMQLAQWGADRLNAIFYPPKPRKEVEPEPEISVQNEWEGVLDGVEDSNPQSDPELDLSIEDMIAEHEHDQQLIEQHEAEEARMLAEMQRNSENLKSMEAHQHGLTDEEFDEWVEVKNDREDQGQGKGGVTR